MSTDGFRSSVRPGSETFAADNGFVLVSALHGENAPEGTLKIVRVPVHLMRR
ncbi:MAG: hypothetical protein R2758_08175 [Bacteroidales bacterium]